MFKDDLFMLIPIQVKRCFSTSNILYLILTKHGEKTFSKIVSQKIELVAIFIKSEDITCQFQYSSLPLKCQIL